jgi:predicted metal-dependent phosphoesterase TrpH
MIKIDFHVHTNSSIDSNIKPTELARKAKKLGIIPAITDHNTTESWEKMKSIVFIPGEEIRTTAGDVIGLFLNEEIPKHLSFEETAERIKEQEGLVYLPHMYDRTRHGCGDEYAHLADIIEVFNGRCIGTFNELAAEAARNLDKPAAAGSDSHFLSEFGGTYTEVPLSDIGNHEELLDALKDAKIVGKRAPFYVRGTTTLLKLGRKAGRRIGIK